MDESNANTKLADYVIKRQDQLEKQRRPWENVWQEIAEHIIPYHSLHFGQMANETAGLNPMTKLYDSYGMYAARTLIRGLQGQMANRSIMWFKPQTEDSKLLKYRENKIYLRELEEGLYAEYRRSNFYNALSEYMMNTAVIGTGNMLSESDARKDRIVFSALHPEQIWIAENAWGEVDTFHRKFKLSSRQALQFFDEANLPEEIVREAKSEHGDKEQKWTFIHAVYPRDDYILGSQGVSGKPWIGYYVNEEKKKVVRRDYHIAFPLSSWRWFKLYNEVYGRGPGLDSLVDIMGLQQISKSNTKSAQYHSQPAYNIPEHMRGKVNLTPGGHNYYDEQGSVITQIANQGRYDIGLDHEQRKKEAIDRHFMVDLFRMLASIERTMTATEIMQRVGEKSSLLGPMTSRMTGEGFDTLHHRTMILAQRAGRLPEPPDSMVDAILKIEYTGPLALAQKRLYEQQGITRSLEQIIQISQFSPEAAQSAQRAVKWEDMMSMIFETNGVDPALMRSARELAEMKVAEAQQQQQLMQQQEMESMGKAMPGLNQVVKPDSPAGALLGA